MSLYPFCGICLCERHLCSMKVSVPFYKSEYVFYDCSGGVTILSYGQRHPYLHVFMYRLLSNGDLLCCQSRSVFFCKCQTLLEVLTFFVSHLQSVTCKCIKYDCVEICFWTELQLIQIVSCLEATSPVPYFSYVHDHSFDRAQQTSNLFTSCVPNTCMRSAFLGFLFLFDCPSDCPFNVLSVLIFFFLLSMGQSFVDSQWTGSSLASLRSFTSSFCIFTALPTWR